MHERIGDVPLERGDIRAWDEAVDLFVEAIDLLEQRQREAEARAQQDVRRAESRAAQAERRQVELERALGQMRGQMARLMDEVAELRQEQEQVARAVASPPPSPSPGPSPAQGGERAHGDEGQAHPQQTEPSGEGWRGRFRSVRDRLGGTGSGSGLLGLTLIGMGVVAVFGTVVWQLSMVLGGAYVVPPPAGLATVGSAGSAAGTAGTLVTVDPAGLPTPAPTLRPAIAPTVTPSGPPVIAAAPMRTPAAALGEGEGDVAVDEGEGSPERAADRGAAVDVTGAPEGAGGPGVAGVAPNADPAEATLLAGQTRPGGYAVRLTIPAIDLDTAVEQAGLRQTGPLAWEWATLPFVAAHYGDLTARVGETGNAVISGHVVTLNQGNVFRNLHRVGRGDAIGVWDDQGRMHLYRVVDLSLVPPADASPMQGSERSLLTLITCGGRFDFLRREFTDRLIVVAELLA